METLTIEFTIDEMNVILAALSNEPFKEVYEIIGKINSEAQKQLSKDTDNENIENPTTK